MAMRIGWNRLYRGLCLLALLNASSALANDVDEYAVIINGDNPYSGSETQMRNEVRLLFLREKFRWGNQLLSMPLSPNQNSPAFQAFRAEVLDMSESQLQAHWNRIKHINGHTAPREVNSERLILRLIQRDRGAFSLLPKHSVDAQSPHTRILFTY